MTNSEFAIHASKNRLTTGTFNMRTRPKFAKKGNPFWNDKNSAPSECVVIKFPQQSSR